jgi:predicted nucleic acid-binding Zn ribbon protein
MDFNPIDDLNNEEERRQRTPHYIFLVILILAMPAIILVIGLGEWIDTVITLALIEMGREGQIALGWTIVALVLVVMVRREIRRS